MPSTDQRTASPALAGRLVFPGDGRWDEARAAWNLAVDQQPAAVALAESVPDVVAAVAWAREHGLGVNVQGTGHNASAIESLTDTLLIRTHRMRGVTVDAPARRVRVEAGALWGDVAAAAQAHGLAALAGSSIDVGVVGYALGGGIGWLSRRHGLASNSVLAIELVTADGRVVRADRDHEPELFWGLRGGNGNFGAVVAMELALVEVAEVFAGMLAFDWTRSAEILKAWRDWTETVPDEVTSAARILQVPPIPDIPEPLRGRRLVVVEAAYAGAEEAGARILAPLRALGPEIDTFATIPAEALGRLHMDPEHPVPGVSAHRMLADLPDRAIDALVAVAGPGSGSPILSVELRQLGGALARVPEGAGALERLDAGYALFAVGMAGEPGLAASVRAHLPAIRNAVAAYDAGRAYANFQEQPRPAAAFFPDAVHARLRALKAAIDPDDVFRANHPIVPAA